MLTCWFSGSVALLLGDTTLPIRGGSRIAAQQQHHFSAHAVGKKFNATWAPIQWLETALEGSVESFGYIVHPEITDLDSLAPQSPFLHLLCTVQHCKSSKIIIRPMWVQQSISKWCSYVYQVQKQLLLRSWSHSSALTHSSKWWK